ncbi:MAG TPA: DNA gyrase C-terminal beta-propeller domain-containing protein, partial [Homoserinimonas sp.]|nr:DNA gyrase C-terminal beta-propeller domain-containing protein [Homoserinimonas sp.]
LEAERDPLRAEIAELELLLSDPVRVRHLVSHELELVAEKYGTPRRTMLTHARPSIATTGSSKQAPVLEHVDVPCQVILSTTGRVIRVDVTEDADVPPRASRRTKHDAIRASVLSTSRTEVGAVTSTGRIIRLSPMDLPVVPASSIQLAAGVKVTDYLAIDSKRERVVTLVSLTSDDPVALGTKQGVVKRVIPADYPQRPDFDVISLKAGDEVVGASQSPDDDELVFITSDAQLLRFPASAVRPQGRSAGGMAGIKLSASAEVVFFAALGAADETVVATISTSATTIAGTDPGRAKVSHLSEFPGKGRATGGVRAHSFLKGEDMLSIAWAGPSPVLAVGSDGSARTLPEAGARRDASGTPLDAVVGSIGREL